MQPIGERVRDTESEADISEDFKASLSLNGEESCSQNPILDHHDDEAYETANELEHDDEDEDNEEEFSFIFEGANTTPITAEDAFMNGKIKPIYPIFDMDPQVKKMFVQIKDDDCKSDDSQLRRITSASASASSGNDEITGPYCEWSKNVPKEASTCKKSYSTGFSKLWRFKEFRKSNSDGRDAFVFLNNNPMASLENNDEVKVKGKKKKASSVKANGEKGKVKKEGKSRRASNTLSSHEVYLKNKANENEDNRRKSYLPYRQEVVGFFTNVNGGMSKNVHPF